MYREIGCTLPGPIDDKELLLINRLTATTAFAPPDPKSLAIIAVVTLSLAGWLFRNRMN